ncbi:phosphotransferase family protein [Streptomyces sp. INA 01156]
MRERQTGRHPAHEDAGGAACPDGPGAARHAASAAVRLAPRRDGRPGVPPDAGPPGGPADQTAQLVHVRGLFVALGVPEDALTGLAGRIPAMARRSYSLLHTDLHRDNLIVSSGGDPPLICVDWELATYGDPLHDLATHLVRMRYRATNGPRWSTPGRTPCGRSGWPPSTAWTRTCATIWPSNGRRACTPM